jgi:enoyl-CoA hydratase
MRRERRMDENVLVLERNDRIGVITLHRPEKRNALSPRLLVELRDLLGQLEKEDEIRCVIIRGAGDQAFSSGFDISDLPVGVSPEMAGVEKEESPLENGMRAIVDFPYPVIAMINGLAYGAGCELAVTCDIRVAADHVRFSMPPAKLGVVYRWRGLLKFIDIVGLATAKEMFFTGRAYEASQAKEMGLVHEVVPRDQLVAFTVRMAQEISEKAPLALKGHKKIFNHCQYFSRMSPEETREIEALRDQAFCSEDVKEGQQAFREKRKPVFKGR